MHSWDILELDLQAAGIDIVEHLDDRPWSWFTKRVMWRLADPKSLTHRLIKAATDEDA